MAIRNIVKVGDPILAKTSRKVEKFDDRLAQLLDDMRETMYQANGVGLAAVQVGILRRAIVIDCGDGYIELVNPEIISSEGEQFVHDTVGYMHVHSVSHHPRLLRKASDR